MGENRDAIIGRCDSGHELRYRDVAAGLCPNLRCPTRELFAGKESVDEEGER